jgi:hypothetical protein
LNQRGKNSLIQCNNDKLFINKQSKQVCQYLGGWHHIWYSKTQQIFVLGETCPELHETDMLLPTEENTIALTQAYFIVQEKANESLEGSIEEELETNQQIWLTPIEPNPNESLMTMQLQTTMTQPPTIQIAQPLQNTVVNLGGQPCLPGPAN